MTVSIPDFPLMRVAAGRRLYAHRRKLGLNQQQVADRVGITQPNVSCAERGIASWDTAVDIARVLDLSWRNLTHQLDVEAAEIAAGLAATLTAPWVPSRPADAVPVAA